MTYIRIEAAHTGDERWIDAGPDAFTVHVWAMVYCDQQKTDGRISKAMAQRVALPVPLDRVEPAIRALVAAGFWEELDGAYRVVDYLQHGLPAMEIRETQKRWARDKKRQRMHANGNHAACDALKCQGAREMSTEDSGKDPTRESIRESIRESEPYIKPNPTRPDPTEGRGSGMGAKAARAATPPARREPHAWEDDTSGISCKLCGLPREHSRHDARVST